MCHCTMVGNKLVSPLAEPTNRVCSVLAAPKKGFFNLHTPGSLQLNVYTQCGRYFVLFLQKQSFLALWMPRVV